MLRAGLDLSGELLALAAASHSGEPPTSTGCAASWPAPRSPRPTCRTPRTARWTPTRPPGGVAAGRAPTPLAQNCSGKHAAMLATCHAAGWDTAGYLDPGHPLQRAIRTTVEELTGVPVAHTAVDGCGAPLFSTTPAGLARAVARIATAPPDTPEGRVAAAMRAHPWWVAGTGRDVVRLAAACRA